MNPDHASSFEASPFRAVLWAAFCGAFRLWGITVAIGFVLAWLHWPIPGSEALYTMAVWAAAILLAPVFMGSDALFEHWGWLLGMGAWLPVMVAFRCAHLVAIPSKRHSL